LRVRDLDEAGIFIKVAIESESMRDAESFHNGKARTVNEAEQVIRISPKDFQSLL